MRLTSEALRELFQRETTRSARGRNNDNCPSVEMLTSAAAGELSHAERDVIGDHLATCSDCANEYRSIRSLKPWAENSSRDLATAATENGAGPVHLLHLPDRQTNVYQPFRKNLAGSRLFSFYVPVALAVLFLILALALAGQLISQRKENQRLVAQVNEKTAQEQQTAGSVAEARRLHEEATRRAERAEAAQRAAQEELTKRSAEQQRAVQGGVANKTIDQAGPPLVNVPIFELHPRSSTRESEVGTIPTLEAAPDTNLITLIIHVSGELSRDRYSVEALDQSGRIIWSGRGLRKSRYNNFTVAIPRRTFPAGNYRLRLYASHDGRRELIEEYAIRFQYR